MKVVKRKIWLEDIIEGCIVCYDLEYETREGEEKGRPKYPAARRIVRKYLSFEGVIRLQDSVYLFPNRELAEEFIEEIKPYAHTVLVFTGQGYWAVKTTSIYRTNLSPEKVFSR